MGGAAIGILGIVSYLPPLAIWTGGGTCIASIISIAVFKFFSKRSGSANGHNSGFISSPGGNSEVLGPSTQVMSNQVNLQNTQSTFVIAKAAQHATAYQSMSTLIEKGQVEEAWKLYLNTSFEEKYGDKPEREFQKDSYLTQAGWLYLPTEQLLNAIMNHWLSEGENIAEKVCPEFIRDCANQYADFRNKCLTEDRLWSCFAGYQEYIADIVAMHPTFGLEVMISHRGNDILLDAYRIEIFRSSCDSFLLIINNSELSESRIKFFANFLLCYQCVIHDEDFEKIKQISRNLIEQQKLHDKESEEYRNYSLYIALIELVEGKLSFQGIYKGERGSTCFPPVEVDLVSGLFDLNWIEEVTRKISAATDEENIRKGLLYLSLIPESSVHYIDSQLMLGNIWLDLENFSEAGRCFLQVAQLNNEHSPDALMLASMSLLAFVKKENGWTFVLREDVERLIESGQDVRTLSHDECKSLQLKKLLETTKRLEEEKNI